MISVRLLAHASAARSYLRFSQSALAIALCWWVAAAVPASATDVVAVEEDWELMVQDPDPNSAGPQVATVLAPLGNVDGMYAVFEMNHRTQPEFTPGGMQLQTWNGEALRSYGNFPNPSLLNQSNETVRWTQRMSLEGSQLIFEITNGISTSWDQFGGQGYLRKSIDTTAGNLNAYDPAVAVKQSGISYAANRVGRLFLKEVRLVMSDGEVLTDTTVRVVHGD